MTVTTAAEHDAPHIALLDPASYTAGQPYDQLLYLQKHDPVHWHPEPDDGPGFWAVTRYEDTRRVLNDPEVFKSFPSDAIPDATSQGDGVNYAMLTMCDPPVHTVRRKHIAHELLPSAVRRTALHVEALCDEILDEVSEQGTCDLVADVAGKLASWVTADLMGLPRPDMIRMYELADRMLNAKETDKGDGLEAVQGIMAYAQTVWDDRRANPRDDLVSRYAHTVVGDREPDFGQFVMDFILIFSAAGDTTRNALGGGYALLFDNPDQYEILRTDPTAVETGVEEMLRMAAPIVYFRRTAAVDTEVGGQKVAAGQKVATFFGPANRDPDVFENPHTFDVRRKRNPHMAFGHGPHFCLGSHLARLELRTMLRALITRMPDIEPAAPIVWARPDLEIAPIVVGPHEMQVRFTPSAKAQS